jgi:hypothetical protein
MVTAYSYLSRACLAFLIVLGPGIRDLHATDDPIAGGEICSASSPRLPPTVKVADELRDFVDTMLRRSATFRDQCQRLAGAPSVHVLVRLNPLIPGSTCRARTVIQRSRAGIIVAIVDIGPWGSPIPWIAHELEHVIEQLEGVRLRDKVAGRSKEVWRSSGEMFETERAIRVGQAVVGELNRKRRVYDKSVE